MRYNHICIQLHISFENDLVCTVQSRLESNPVINIGSEALRRFNADSINIGRSIFLVLNIAEDCTGILPFYDLADIAVDLGGPLLYIQGRDLHVLAYNEGGAAGRSGDGAYGHAVEFYVGVRGDDGD